jgi:hypothetical protein
LDEFWINVPFNRGLGFISFDNSASITIELRKPDPSQYMVGYNRHDAIQVGHPRPRKYFGFAAAREPDVSFVWIPYWFLVPLSVVTGIAPWLHWRFRLRTLLIAVTVIVVVLGLILALFPVGPGFE